MNYRPLGKKIGLHQSIKNISVCVCVCEVNGAEGRKDRLVNMEGVPEWKNRVSQPSR